MVKKTNQRSVKIAAAQTKPAPASLVGKVKSTNRWRDSLNPCRGLTVSRAVQLIEAYPRGMYADLMWTFGAPFTGIENADADLLALIERRTGALLEMDWTVKTVSDKKPGFDKKLADEQAAALRESYDRIDNLYEAAEHFCMATFRGFSHTEKHRNAAGDLAHLEIVDQWNVVRDGLRGAWKYNPNALETYFEGLGDELLMDPEGFVIREVRRPVNRIGLLKFIRSNMAQKDWDAFIEIYGIPGGVVILPPNIPQGKEAEYETSAKQLSEGGSGALPNGSTYTPNDSPRGVNPFRDYLGYLTEKLILAGTGGLLTMLTAPGSGTLAGNAHAEAFSSLAKAEARRISEVFQRSIDAEVLTSQFPNAPRLAYFEFAANEETDTGAFVKDVTQLSQAGYEVAVGQITEKTGYEVTVKAAPTVGLPPVKVPDLTNRAKVDDLAAKLEAAVSAGGVSDAALSQLMAGADLDTLARALEAALGIAIIKGAKE